MILTTLKKLPKQYRQFIKFCFVGTISTLIDVGTYTLLTRALPFFREYYLIANVISFIVALINSYTLNRKFTFRNKHKKVGVQFTKYITVYTIGLGLSTLILYIFVDIIGLYDLLAKVLTVGIVLFWNFVGSKFLIFDRDEKKDHSASQDAASN